MDEMRGKVCIVTGSSSGIGKEIALALANMSATVVNVVRNRERGEKALNVIINKTVSHAADLMICDISSMESIKQFANEFRHKYDRLDVLINNAGTFVGKRQITIDGFERTLAVNYLAPFLLTHELLPLLKSSVPSRVINLGSGLHGRGKIDFDDLQSEKEYGAAKTYAKSKLMLVMYTYELAKRLESIGVTVNIVEPGFVATNLGKNSGSRLLSLVFSMTRPFQISAKKGADPIVYLASSDQVKDLTGKCFLKLREKTTAKISYDREMQKLLWDATFELLGLSQKN